jgi:hypothetical protein
MKVLLVGLTRSLKEHPAEADSDVPAPTVPSPPADMIFLSGALIKI